MLSTPFEQRIFNVFFFGLIPALTFRLGGYVLSRSLLLSVDLCDALVTSCFHSLARLKKTNVKWAFPLILKARGRLIIRPQHFRSELYNGSYKTYTAINRLRRRACATLLDLVCLLIRNTARFIIRILEVKGNAVLVLNRLEDSIPSTLRISWKFKLLVIIGAFALGLGVGWVGLFACHGLFDVKQHEANNELSMDAVVDQIIMLESSGNQNARNKRSSATGLGQFLDQTWLELIRAHRSDLAKGRSQDAILELRTDGKIARELTAIFTKQNAAWLKKRGFPVTPGTLYLAHFAGAGGAAAILSAVETADVASIMASADVSGRTKREVIVKTNPFLQNFTVADLRSWADRKMRIPGS